MSNFIIWLSRPNSNSVFTLTLNKLFRIFSISYSNMFAMYSQASRPKMACKHFFPLISKFLTLRRGYEKIFFCKVIVIVSFATFGWPFVNCKEMSWPIIQTAREGRPYLMSTVCPRREGYTRHCHAVFCSGTCSLFLVSPSLPSFRFHAHYHPIHALYSLYWPSSHLLPLPTLPTPLPPSPLSVRPPSSHLTLTLRLPLLPFPPLPLLLFPPLP